MKGLTAISDVALITVGGPGIVGVSGRFGPHLRNHGGGPGECPSDLAVVLAKRYLSGCSFVRCRAHGRGPAARVCPGSGARKSGAHHPRSRRSRSSPLWARTCVVRRTVGRTFTALGRENLNIIAIAQGSSECNFPSCAKEDVGRTRCHSSGISVGYWTREHPVRA